jgi:hypothetical protein
MKQQCLTSRISAKSIHFLTKASSYERPIYPLVVFSQSFVNVEAYLGGGTAFGNKS